MSVDVLSDRDSARERADPVIRRERLAISNRRHIVGPAPDTFGIITKIELSADLLDPGSSDWREEIVEPGFVGLAISGGGVTLFSGAAVVLRGSLLDLIVWLPILAGFFILALPFSTNLNWLGAGVVGAFVTVCILNSLGTGFSR